MSLNTLKVSICYQIFKMLNEFKIYSFRQISYCSVNILGNIFKTTNLLTWCVGIWNIYSYRKQHTALVFDTYLNAISKLTYSGEKLNVKFWTFHPKSIIECRLCEDSFTFSFHIFMNIHFYCFWWNFGNYVKLVTMEIENFIF